LKHRRKKEEAKDGAEPSNRAATGPSLKRRWH